MRHCRNFLLCSVKKNKKKKTPKNLELKTSRSRGILRGWRSKGNYQLQKVFLFERSSELGRQKKKIPRRRRRPPILYLVKQFTFLSKFLPFSPSFNPPKTFSYVFHFHNLPKRHPKKTIFANKFF